MDQELVSRLERELERAVATAVKKIAAKRLPMQPSRQTIHLMSKAAVSVYEAAVAAHERRD
ncbi:MAG: hypothetical protein R3C10_01415 [Pirellulales bacterium]